MTELVIRDFQKKPEMLKLQGSRLRDSDGRITDNGHSVYTVYSKILHLCDLQSCGKSRQFVVPACVVTRIQAV